MPFTGVVIGVAAVVGAGVVVLSDVARQVQPDDEAKSAWVEEFEKNPSWLAVAPNEVPDGAVIVSADGIGEGRDALRTLTFQTTSGEFATLCVAQDPQVATSECGEGSTAKSVIRGRVTVTVAVDTATASQEWLNGFTSTEPKVSELNYLS